jgi:hypothetical protein
MKKTLCFVCTCYLFAACKAPRYSYVSPTMNTPTYSHAGEGQVGVQFGSSGFTGKGGIALTQNININAWGSIFPESNNGYDSREAELSIGYQTNPSKHKSATSVYIGMSTGRNEKDTIGLKGSFNRSFLQVQTAAFDHELGKAAYLDAFLGLRVNYLSYTGTKGLAPLNDYLFYYEPYFGITLGGKNVRFEIMQGWAIKNSGEWGQGVRIFPFLGNLGMLVKLRRE